MVPFLFDSYLTTMLLKPRVQIACAAVALLLLIVACYYPGLFGGFVFDDEVNILQNKQLHVRSLSVTDLQGAALSGHAGPLGRPIALLSFALNLYTSGTDPFFFKLSNLAIHLLNTILVGALATVLFRARRQISIAPALGLAVAAIWGLHPLNLTSVLYVVQRMTSLSAGFGLAALLVYATLRTRQIEGPKITNHRVLGSNALIAALLVASVLTKESGALFLPLLLWVEYCVFGFAGANGSINRPLRNVVTLCIAGAAVFVILFVLPRMLGNGSYANRDFTLIERALTETRILMSYLKMVWLPRNSELSLYHDDIVVSSGLFEPPATILSIFALVLISSFAFLSRRKFPWLFFGWGWFLIAHALESTIFPLELAHEHRNYFATFGLFMAVIAILECVHGVAKKGLILALVAYALLLGIVTFVRSEQWSNPVDLALLEASNHPNSARANYELGRIYLALMISTGEQKYAPMARGALRRSAESYKPGVGPYFGLIQLAYYTNEEPESTDVVRLKQGLEVLPFYNANVPFLQSFLLCQLDGRCKMRDSQALGIFEAALKNPLIPKASTAEVLKQMGQYYIGRGELPEGVKMIERASLANDLPSTRIMLAQAYGMDGQWSAALEQLDMAGRLDTKGAYASLIRTERANLRSAATLVK